MRNGFRAWLAAAAVVMLPPTVAGCEGELSESEARRVIDEQVIPGDPKGVRIIHVNLQRTPSLWKSGYVAGLTTEDKCWLEVSSIGLWQDLTKEQISPQCPDIFAARLGLSDGQWWANEVDIAAYRLKVDEIVEILTRDGVAKIVYKAAYYETELYKKWRQAGLRKIKHPDPGPASEACLQKWDQGWRLCGH
jgi:hypothetical protein